MRRYEKNQSQELVQVICNKCGKELKVKDGILKEGAFQADYLFGYFSKKDGTRHHFDLCEDCYDRLVGGFAVPVEADSENELL